MEAFQLSTSLFGAGRSSAGSHTHGDEQSDVFDGCAWTYRNGFDAVLRSVPAAAWAHPAAQGWTCVKRNSARTVWRARIGDRAYFLKYYRYGSKFDRLKSRLRAPACAAEWRCAMFALRAGVPAVSPAGYAAVLPADAEGRSVLVTEALEPAWPLNEFWATVQTDDDVARRRADSATLIERVAELIARAHQAGLEHTDMHAENILVHRVGPRDYRAAFVDLHSARLDAPIYDADVIRNLSQLNQWFRRHASICDRVRFLRSYMRWRNEYEHQYAHGREIDLAFPQLVSALAEAAERHAERIWAQRDRRALRDGRYFSRVRTADGWSGFVFACCKRPRDESVVSSMRLKRRWWEQQLAAPLRWFEPDGAEWCKDSHSASVRRVMLTLEDGRKIQALVKRPLARDWRRRVRMLFGPSRSRRGWRMANALLHRDQPTARPLAMIERRRGPFILDSLLLIEWLPEAVALDAYLRREHPRASAAEWFDLKRRLIARLVRRLRSFHHVGFAHRDCKASNILIVEKPRLEVVWTDMDGVRRPRHAAAADQKRALARLHASLADAPGVTRADRLRFLNAYLAQWGRGRPAWKSVWRELEAVAETKLAAKQRRKAWKLAKYGRE